MTPLPALLAQLGRTIRNLRKRKGLSQERFGFAIGLHRTYIYHLEHGSANPTLATLYLVARGLDVTVTELIAAAAQPTETDSS